MIRRPRGDELSLRSFKQTRTITWPTCRLYDDVLSMTIIVKFNLMRFPSGRAVGFYVQPTSFPQARLYGRGKRQDLRVHSHMSHTGFKIKSHYFAFASGCIFSFKCSINPFFSQAKVMSHLASANKAVAPQLC